VVPAPPEAVADPTQSVTPPAPPHGTEAASGARTAEAPADGPDLLIYYPSGSTRAEASARNLAAQIGSNVTNSDVRAGGGPSDHAAIRFSGERNHTLARMIGRSLGEAGYHWKIDASPSRGNTIEVWLPAK
jgi:hypothetical protein